MSGLLRRIKRSRAAGAGENPAEEQAAGPEDAPTTAEPSAADDASAATAELTATPVVKADPDVPAGLDPAESGAPLVTGRRGKLRRRLRYLRRARELMLRDLGGLFYEVHRTAGGDLAPHAAVVATKVERLSGLDAETAAIETALGAPRSEAIVFQPGVGGTCDVCGELYGSAALFCSNCGSPIGSAVRATPAPPAEPRPVPAMPKAPALPEPAAEAGPATDDTKVLGAPDETPAAEQAEAPAAEQSDAPAEPAEAPAAEQAEPPAAPAEAPAAEQSDAPAEPAEAPAAEQAEPPAATPEATDEPKDDRKPSSSLPNGRTDDGTPPELSSGDPLTVREGGP